MATNKSPVCKNARTVQKGIPGTFAIADCTGLKIRKPSSLKAQSQTYSNYKSTKTLKGLVVVDPRGSVIVSSTLFAGAKSDEQIFIQSGLQSLLKQLVATGYLKEADGIMGDKGFDISKEVKETSLKLNIPLLLNLVVRWQNMMYC